MTAKHRDPVWRKTCRIIRQQVRLAWARGEDVVCWRHGHIIPPEAPYDVGHISHGGKIGAKLTNARRQAKTTGVVKPTWA